MVSSFCESVARNDADVSSDIDVLIDFEPDAESFDNLMNVADLPDMRFDAPVDLVTVNGLSPAGQPIEFGVTFRVFPFYVFS